MKNIWLRVIASLLIFIMACSLLPITNLKASINSMEGMGALLFRDLSVDEMVEEMGAGWNLGNTMDGHTGFSPSETVWQSVETTKELIKSVHDLGFNTVRLPVTWGTMIDDENGYAIDEVWMSRVQDIVDYCISQDMYVIINVHHDGAEQSGWLRVASDDIDSVYEKFEGVWGNIAERFKDYDEHVIFESMNEITGGDDSDNGKVRDMNVIMELNQIFVDTIRATGSNNEKRWLSVPGRYTNIAVTTDEKYAFHIPTDTTLNKLFVSVHYYDYGFGLIQNQTNNTFSYDQALYLANDFEKLVTNFTSKGIPVILGEYGCLNKNNSVERAYHVEVVTRLCQQSGVVACYWDQGWYDRSTQEPDYSFTLVDRTTGKTIDNMVTDAVMRGTFVKATSDDLSDIVKDTKVTDITDITLSTEELSLVINESQKITAEIVPTASNDVLLWRTDDSFVATVYNGNVRARGIGTTTITAFSQSGTIEKIVKVTVSAEESENPCKSIILENDSYDLIVEQSVFLNATMNPETTDSLLTYKSSNENVASVSPLGKVVAKASGITYIVITASSGLTKVVKIAVSEGNQTGLLSMALNVYYNDETTGYFSNEVGEPITISEDGQYTVVFDCATDLSSQAISAGVTGINNLTAVYIKDDDVTNGKTKKSPLQTCDIMYNEVIVDGVELTINQIQPKSAIKASGVLDTNDPLNSWEGSYVDEVEVNNHILNIVGIDNPQKIQVTFTISNLVFATSEGATLEEAESIEPSTVSPISLTAKGEEKEIIASLLPTGKNLFVTFYSSDASIVSVDTKGIKMESENGIASTKITAMSSGSATITAITDNGLQVVFDVIVDIPEDVSGDSDLTNTKDKKNDIQNKNLMIVIICIGVILVSFGCFVFIAKKKKN